MKIVWRRPVPSGWLSQKSSFIAVAYQVFGVFYVCKNNPCVLGVFVVLWKQMYWGLRLNIRFELKRFFPFYL